MSIINELRSWLVRNSLTTKDGKKIPNYNRGSRKCPKTNIFTISLHRPKRTGDTFVTGLRQNKAHPMVGRLIQTGQLTVFYNTIISSYLLPFIKKKLSIAYQYITSLILGELSSCKNYCTVAAILENCTSLTKQICHAKYFMMN